MRRPLLAFLLLVTPAFAQVPAMLQQALKDTDVHPAWIYNDLDRGFAEAKKTGKPLLVVLRCVT
jgi:hypothetical protein